MKYHVTENKLISNEANRLALNTYSQLFHSWNLRFKLFVSQYGENNPKELQAPQNSREELQIASQSGAHFELS